MNPTAPVSTPVHLERQDLIRANIKLRDQNEQLRLTLEDVQSRMPRVMQAAAQVEYDRQFWKWVAGAVGGTLLAILVTLGFAWWTGGRQ